jgi:hypothetical protein
MIFAATAVCARADWRFDAETGAFYDSNLSNSDRAAEERDAWAWRSDLTVSNGFQLMRDLRLNLAGDVHGEVWDRFDSFDQIALGGTATLRYRFGLGPKAPWISIDDRIAYARFHETARSGYDEQFRARGGVNITDRIALEAAYIFQNHAAPNRFYDIQAHSADARVIVDLTSSLQVALGYTYRNGGVISYAIPPRPEIAAFAIEREDEDTFGTPLRTAYKFRADSHAVSVSASYALPNNFSVQIGYTYVATLRDPLTYENHLVEAKIAFAY